MELHQLIALNSDDSNLTKPEAYFLKALKKLINDLNKENLTIKFNESTISSLEKIYADKQYGQIWFSGFNNQVYGFVKFWNSGHTKSFKNLKLSLVRTTALEGVNE